MSGGERHGPNDKVMIALKYVTSEKTWKNDIHVTEILQSYVIIEVCQISMHSPTKITPLAMAMCSREAKIRNEIFELDTVGGHNFLWILKKACGEEQ